MQSTGANSSVELAEGRVAAPLEAAWDSIRSGLRRDLGARTFDGWLKPAELGAFLHRLRPMADRPQTPPWKSHLDNDDANQLFSG